MVGEIENPFSITVMLVPEGAGEITPLGWELDKDEWRRLRAERVEVHLPAEAIMPLRK